MFKPKRIIALFVALAMTVAVAVPLMAEDGNCQGGNGNQNGQGQNYCDDGYITIITLPGIIPIVSPYPPEED